MEKIGTSHSLRFIVKDVLCRAADCYLDIRKETGQKEEFLYKCILLY